MEAGIKELFYFLVAKERNGRITLNDQQMNSGMAAAILIELTHKEHVNLEGKRLVLKGHPRSKDEALAEMIRRMEKSSRPKKISSWISTVNLYRGQFYKAVKSNLLKTGLVREETMHFLGFIPYKIYFVNKPKLREEHLKRLRKSILENKYETFEDSAIALITGSSQLLFRLFKDRKERRIARQNIKELRKNNPFGEAVNASVQAVNAAIFAATTVGTTAGS
ncbi:MAG: GPP34 family phosphoprotein [Bacteroidales bacterium]|nr:GPP34 family phosphoprotein [Bacteroidales bacterium]